MMTDFEFGQRVHVLAQVKSIWADGIKCRPSTDQERIDSSWQEDLEWECLMRPASNEDEKVHCIFRKQTDIEGIVIGKRALCTGYYNPSTTDYEINWSEAPSFSAVKRIAVYEIANSLTICKRILALPDDLRAFKRNQGLGTASQRAMEEVLNDFIHNKRGHK